uniref:Protein kinase domain-containing protein n=1 Tax=Paramoeba aestuarina TaxID=180227 RepID=A0A7S4U7K2_9EUKA|mmetsp:Transcript_4837/g.7231  ORF Transcript_4837/g.7231 Transcript_4837/m.7231 type:complete len:871 (+) Transcript_4837:144-2756(+)|eukprot:CAMPEP_0201510062 /NCGR_PEP_ID=MMETSP0161_2-20130828/2911_1 /ASSEMBLY_ACC=CAM_ASM_000251 /TAXON_ID=180227 /ORGANISM="Neoparamoeba aestuarina, Strain SoJaBio B1-5/56/2" /LENGTH=870 /DNA_ID=CAMNT_0047905179 /DNA_START=634 /DNA_END=3246 /DNA_ORIENTATION=-
MADVDPPASPREKEGDQVVDLDEGLSGGMLGEGEWVPDDPPSFWFEDQTRGSAFESAFNQAEDHIHRSAIERASGNQSVWQTVMSNVQSGCTTLDAEFDKQERALANLPPLEESSSEDNSASTQSSFLPSSFEKITPEQAESLLRWANMLSNYANSHRNKKHKEGDGEGGERTGTVRPPSEDGGSGGKTAEDKKTDTDSPKVNERNRKSQPARKTEKVGSGSRISSGSSGSGSGSKFLDLFDLGKSPQKSKHNSSSSLSGPLIQPQKVADKKAQEKERRIKVLTGEHFFAMAHGQFVAARPLLGSRPDFYFHWALSSLRFSHLMEKEGKDLPFAFALSIFSGFLFERSLSLDIFRRRAWKKWSRVIDTLLYLYPTNEQVIQMISIFLTSYKAVLIPDTFAVAPPSTSSSSSSSGSEDEEDLKKRLELLEELSLKPLVALALSRDLDDGLKRQSVSLLREVSRNGANQSLKNDSIQCLTYLLPIMEQQEVLFTGKGRIPYHRLPEKAKRMVIDSKLPADNIKEHYDILLNCLSFLVYIPGLPSDDPFKVRQKRPVPMPEYIKYVSESPAKAFFSSMTKIGGGAYGNVFVAKPKSAFGKEIGVAKQKLPSRVAIKTCKCRSPSDFAYIREEVKLHKDIDHKNFVGYLGSFFYDNHVWIVLNYCDGGSLYDVLRQKPTGPIYPVVPENIIAYVAYEVLQGLQYLHEHNNIHRDIKSDNILLDSHGRVKIADLGECTALKSMETSMRMAGSRFWMAPEVILRHPYGTKADVYSFGALVMEMIEGDPPYWTHRSLKALFYTALYGPPPIRMSARTKISDQLVDLVKKSMDPNPSTRPTSGELLSHEFFQKRAKRDKVVKFLEHWPGSSNFLGTPL